MARLRTLGAAMFAWQVDRHGEFPSNPQQSGAGRVYWPACESVTSDDLTALLVPDFLAELPATDGWGRPFELCFSVGAERRPAADADGKARYVAIVGARSAGADGVFAADTYRPGAFPATETAHDIVWVDGYFLTWPESPTRRP